MSASKKAIYLRKKETAGSDMPRRQRSEQESSDLTALVSLLQDCKIFQPYRRVYEQLTSISFLNLSATFFLWTFCAAVVSPFSGVHSSGVRITACRSSIVLNWFFFPASLHLLSTSFTTSGSSQRSCNDSFALESGSVARRCDSLGMMTAMGCLASGVACTQMFETRLQDL